VKARRVECDQDVSVEKIGNETFPGLRKDNLVQASPKPTFRFLCSPKEIVVGPNGRIRQFVVTLPALPQLHSSRQAERPLCTQSNKYPPLPLGLSWIESICLLGGSRFNPFPLSDR
jgi:hypothetical protein